MTVDRAGLYRNICSDRLFVVEIETSSRSLSIRTDRGKSSLPYLDPLQPSQFNIIYIMRTEVVVEKL